jgi:predicted nucleic acid-binding protein
METLNFRLTDADMLNNIGEIYYGALKAKLEKRGLAKSEPDLRIASITLQHRLTLVTANIKRFQDISGLTVESWL